MRTTLTYTQTSTTFSCLGLNNISDERLSQFHPAAIAFRTQILFRLLTASWQERSASKSFLAPAPTRATLAIRAEGCQSYSVIRTNRRHERNLALTAAVNELFVIVIFILALFNITRRRLREARPPDCARRDLKFATLTPGGLLQRISSD